MFSSSEYAIASRFLAWSAVKSFLTERCSAFTIVLVMCLKAS
jgi:hypothetical protein